MCTKFAACTTWTCGLRLFTTCPYFARSPQNIFRWIKMSLFMTPELQFFPCVSKFAETRKETSRNGRAGRSLTHLTPAQANAIAAVCPLQVAYLSIAGRRLVRRHRLLGNDACNGRRASVRH